MKNISDSTIKEFIELHKLLMLRRMNSISQHQYHIPLVNLPRPRVLYEFSVIRSNMIDDPPYNADFYDDDMSIYEITQPTQ